MKSIRLSSMVLAAGVLALSACADSTSSDTLFDDAVVTTDVASSAGDAMATSLEVMAANEGSAVLPSAAILASPADNTLSFNRTKTCYDVNGAVVAGCSPVASVRKVVSHVTADGNRSGSRSVTGGATVMWSGAVHRVADDTATRNFNGTTEQSRNHSGASVGHDTTTFEDGTVSRKAVEVAHDTHKNVVWNVPRSSNPFPVSGQIVRVDSVHVTVTKGTSTETRDVVRTVQVDFPADAQGNVALKVNGKTCNLNLVTHTVSACS